MTGRKDTESVQEWNSDISKRQALAQTISDAFYAMEAGTHPTKEQQREPNTGDVQLAFDILNRFDISPK